MTETANLGRICWYQLVTCDAESAHQFYAKVVGWDGDETEDPSQADSVWSKLKNLSTLVTIDEDSTLPPHWRAYICVPDIESACHRAVMGGGEVFLESTEIEGLGKIALLGDILGAIFAVVEPSEPLPEHPEGEVSAGQFCWSELGTESYKLAFRFYEGIFHWAPGRAVNIPNGRIYQMFKHGDREIGAILDLKRDEDVPPHWMHYIHVPSVDEAVERAMALGGQVVIEAHNVADGTRTACLTDPQGAVFSLWSPGSRGSK